MSLTDEQRAEIRKLAKESLDSAPAPSEELIQKITAIFTEQ